jgi:hypothetical protein
LFIVAACSGTVVVSSVSDTGGNTWTVDRTHTSAGIASISVCSAYVTNALVSGNTITLTLSGSAYCAALCEEFSGGKSSAYKDGVASAGAASNSTVNTGLTATLLESTELQIVGVARDGSASVTLTDTTSGMSKFTTEKVSSSSTVRTVHGRYKIGVGTAAVDYQGSLSSARTHNEATVTYLAATGGGGGGGVWMPQSLALLKVGA